MDELFQRRVAVMVGVKESSKHTVERGTGGVCHNGYQPQREGDEKPHENDVLREQQN